MDAMRPYDRAQIGHAQERAHRKPAMHEAIVNDHIRNAEERHSYTTAVRDLAQQRRRGRASVEDEPESNGRMQYRQRVVGFEAPAPRRMVRPVDRPEDPVPHATVKHRRPKIHRGEGHKSRRQPDEGARQRGGHRAATVAGAE